MTMQCYLVLGVWLEDNARFAASCDANSPDEAEAIILDQYTGENSDNPDALLLIAGVVAIVNGEMEVVG